MTICVDGLVYELSVSLDSTENDSGTKPDSVICVKLIKQGKVVGKSIFPLSGRCPIEEDIKVEASDNGFIIRIPYCDGFLFRFGEARFVYSKGQDDFILVLKSLLYCPPFLLLKLEIILITNSLTTPER